MERRLAAILMADVVGYSRLMEMAERNRERPGDDRMDLRMGLHLGDMIIEGDDILGDAVNIAARLEALAQAGGLCRSRTSPGRSMRGPSGLRER